MKMRMLDLFSGLGGASEAFVQHPDWTVIRIDSEPLLESVPHTFIMDIASFNPDSYIEFDLIWASPPCTQFSTANQNRVPALGIPLVQAAIDIIKAANPRCWIIENVKGSIKHLQPLLGPPRLILGPYVFWGNFPLFWVDMEGYSKMEGDTWSDDPLRPQKRAYVPLEISVGLLEALRTQATLERWIQLDIDCIYD
jgi:site-specific DNA-cytosine methylase